MSSLTVGKKDIAAVGTSGSTDEDDSCNKETLEIKTQPKPPPKPKRPFTAYNIFFQLERSYILQTADGSTYLPKLDANNIDVNTSSRPPKYRDIIMAKNWYNIQVHSNRKKNRSKKYRENHGEFKWRVEVPAEQAKQRAEALASGQSFFCKQSCSLSLFFQHIFSLTNAFPFLFNLKNRTSVLH